MRTSIALLILALTASQVMGTCFGPSALTAILTGATGATIADANIVAAAGTAIDSTATGAKCFPTTGTKMCVKTPADETLLVNNVQSYVDAQKTAMETASGVRDAYIIEKRGEVVAILSSVRRLNELAKGNPSVTIPAAFSTVAAQFVGYADAIAANFTAIVENFATYQEQRATCMNALLKTQAGLLCAYFLETATGVTHHATTPTVAIIDATLTNLNTECYNYIVSSVKQSSIILTAAYSKGIANLVTGIEKLVAGDATAAATALTSAFTTFGTVTFSSTASQVPAKTPAAAGSACSGTSCNEWIEDLFSPSTGVLVQADAVRGGQAASTIIYPASRVLREGKERRLAVAGYTVTLANFNNFVSTAFKTNPGSVDNTKNAKSALRNGVVAVAVAALALIF